MPYDFYQAEIAIEPKPIPNIETTQAAEGSSLATDNLDSSEKASISNPVPESITIEVDEVAQCLFCTHASNDLDDALSHMQRAHGFIVPNQDHLATDLETLITYLALVIDVYHACLLCGHEKHSPEAVRAHMQAKGHCQLDLSEGSEYLDFWTSHEDQADDQPQSISSIDGEFRLASGVIISTKSASRKSAKRYQNRKESPEQNDLVMSGTDLSFRTSRSCLDLTSSFQRDQTKQVLARRDASGIVGLTDGQKRSLAVAHRRAKTTEDRARNRAQWTLEKMGNQVKQKHFKVGSMCRSGIFIDPTMF